ncbi:hypothetical protein [Actinophytocola oryzae]|nr:hypothetical protein [Actinophytocola oryzae]
MAGLSEGLVDWGPVVVVAPKGGSPMVGLGTKVAGGGVGEPFGDGWP